MSAHRNSLLVKPKYSLHPGLAHENASLANLKKSTGKSLEEWVEIVKKSGPATEKERAGWLKSEHELGTNISGWIADAASGRNEVEDYDPATLVEAMYSGKKAVLMPIYEQLLELAFSLGDDVKACPCKTFVPLYRKNVFAQIKPTTNTRIDLGLALKDCQAVDPLIDTGGCAKGDRITHRIPIMGPEQIDAQVRAWLKKAYDLNNPKS